MGNVEEIDLDEILSIGLNKDKMYRVEFYLVPDGNDGHVVEDVMIMGVLKPGIVRVLHDDEVIVKDVKTWETSNATED